MTFLYPERACVRIGDTIDLHADASLASVQFGRAGRTFEPVGACPLRFDVPLRWRPGVYIALANGANTFDGRSDRALVVVRPLRARAPLLVVLPLFTYHAYNVAQTDGTKRVDEGACLYSGARWVSLHRPGGGTGGHPWDEVNRDAYDLHSPRQTFAHWDAKGIAWLEARGYSYDCCTDVEVHDGSVDLGAYRALLSFGHHEYWTRAMRERVESYVRSGGNVAFFGGNTCWFELAYDRDAQRIRRVGRWRDDPEWRFTGVSYACGGGKWIGQRPPSGYRVTHAHHWIYAGTGVREGECFGEEQRLLGYECDGAPLESDLDVLAEGSVRAWPVADGSGEVSTRGCASLGVRRMGGSIFTASTVDWARVLERGDPLVERISRNVLERFTANQSGRKS